MADDDVSDVEVRRADCDAGAPRQWIYQNLTPWRIHAWFKSDGSLWPRPDNTRNGDEGRRPEVCDPCVANVLSIPALGEVAVPHEDARRFDTLGMRRLGQLEVRPASSELLTKLPQAVLIFGWLLVALFFGAWALFFGGGSALPWAWVVASVVMVPVLALIVATVRELHLYRRFARYRRAQSECNEVALHRAARRDRRKQACRDAQAAQAPVSAAASQLAGTRSLEGVDRGSRIGTFIDGMPRQAAEAAVLIGAVVVTVVGLGVAIHQTTQLNDLMPIDYGALVRLNDPFTEVSALARSSPAFWQLLVGHVAQWVLVSIAALAPAAMYFQFDRERLASVQRRWVQEVFRLDPTVRTVRDIEAKYGSQIEASFGVLGPDSGLRLRSGRRSPVIVATILLVVGWFLVISTTQVPNLVAVDDGGGVPGSPASELVWSSPDGDGENAASEPAASGADPLVAEGTGDGAGDGQVAVATDGSFPVSTFFRPDLTLVGYAFLGAYVFTLLYVIRGYQRRDLHPKTYNTIVVRILVAYALALVVSVVYTDRGAEVLMFFVGFMPQSALVWLREKLAQNQGIWKNLPLHEPAPLTELEGIDLYDRTRLAEEGINNVEALAHADIVELTSNTRIPAAQLVDWADQAILYLRVGGDVSSRPQRPSGNGIHGLVASVMGKRDEQPRPSSTTTSPPLGGASIGQEPGDAPHLDPAAVVAGEAEPPSPPSPDPAVRRNLCHLRLFGIRTATDLLQAYEQALRRGRCRESRAAEIRLLRESLELPGAPTRGKVCTIQTIIDTLPDEEWFVQIRNWRRPEFGAVDSWYWYLDGHDWTLQRAQLPSRVERAKGSFESFPTDIAADAGCVGHHGPRPDGASTGLEQPTNGDGTGHDAPSAVPAAQGDQDARSTAAASPTPGQR